MPVISGKFVSFALYNKVTGVPLTGITPTFTYYGDYLGTPLTPPTITELGGGKYGFIIPAVHLASKVAFLVYGGASSGRYISGGKSSDGTIIAFHLVNADGTLFSGVGTPSFALYDNTDGTPATPPSIFSIQSPYLWGFTPSSPDLDSNVGALISSPANAYPSYLDITVARELEGSSGLTILSNTPSAFYIDLVFSDTMATPVLQAANPQYWVFSGLVYVQCTQVQQISSNTLRIHHTEPKGGQTYTLSLPENGLKSVLGVPYNGASQITFTSVAQAPTALVCQVLDYQTIRIVYSESVEFMSATNPNNYSINNGLSVLNVSRETDNIYILTTTPQAAAVTYTVTVTNVLDSKGNPV